MKISLNWLKDYISFEISLKDFCHKLTMSGIEVEKVEERKGDTLIDVEVTPNRPDCLNMLGIARDLGAILNKKVNSPKIIKPAFPKDKADIKIEDKDGCSCYLGTVIEGINVKRASEKIIIRISSVGLRPINNVVDITNFCLMETGQPMHAFDYDKLIGGKIIVRRAKKGEKIITIDNVERELDPSILVIADEKRPVAIAGIMGGKETEVTDKTKNILLESAYFNPILIRRASRKLALSSDSSYRFERGVDLDMVEKGAYRAISLILDDAKGKITAYLKVLAGKKRGVAKSVTISMDEINSRIGTKIPASKGKTIMQRLGFKVVGTANFTITPPSFRADVKRKVDVIEEVARIIGYDNIPLSIPKVLMSNIPVALKRVMRSRARDVLCSSGLNEIITFTMISQDLLKKAKQDNLPVVKVQNPLTFDQEIMRPSLLPCLLNVLASNVKRGQKDLFLFEMGKIYFAKEEAEAAGIIMTGTKNANWRNLKKNNVDYYDVKGAVEEMARSLGTREKDITCKLTESLFLERGQSAAVYLKGKEIGVIGKLKEEILLNFDTKRTEAYFAQICLEPLYSYAKEEKKFVSIPEFPSIKRDISLAVQEEVSAQMVKDEIWKNAPKDKEMALSSVQFIEKYEGDKIPEGHRGLMFSLEYQSTIKTLTDQDVESAHQKICENLLKNLRVVIR